MELLKFTASRLECSLWIWNRKDKRYEFVGDSNESIWGLAIPSGTHIQFEDILGVIEPEYRQLIINAMFDLPVPVDLAIRIRHQVKGRRWLRVRTYPLNDPECNLFTGVTRDVTEEVESASLEQARNAALQRADRLATLGVLSASLAHDLNHSLNGISLASSLLEQWMHELLPAVDQLVQQQPGLLVAGATIAEVRQQIPMMTGGILDAVRRMASMHAQQRNYIKGLGQPSTDIDVGDLIRGVVSFVQPFLDRAPARCHIQVAQEPLMIHSQRVGVEQILMNLLTNAAQALAGRGGSITIAADAEAIPGILVLSVGDDGPGIPLEHQGQLGAGFFTTRRDGTGLGWAIIRRVLDSLQGTYTIDSQSGSGTHIRIMLPIRMVVDQESVLNGLAASPVITSADRTL